MLQSPSTTGQLDLQKQRESEMQQRNQQIATMGRSKIQTGKSNQGDPTNSKNVGISTPTETAGTIESPVVEQLELHGEMQHGESKLRSFRIGIPGGIPEELPGESRAAPHFPS